MGPPDNGTDRRGAAADYPAPPFSVELIADLHADVLPADVADHVRAHLDEDDNARSVLAALDHAVAQVRSAPVPSRTVPPAVTDRTAKTLAHIRAEVLDRGAGTVTHLESARQQRARRGRWLAVGGAAVAASIAAVVAITVGVGRSPQPVTPVEAQHQPTATKTVPAAERASLLSVLGHKDFAPFGSEAALRRCTAANGVPTHTVVLGSGPVTLDGREAVVILLATGVAGLIDALVVAPECTTNHPLLINRMQIGG
ncbi:hypothetical protein ACWDTI_04215 [Gordonia sp. NPDC003424]